MWSISLGGINLELDVVDGKVVPITCMGRTRLPAFLRMIQVDGKDESVRALTWASPCSVLYGRSMIGWTWKNLACSE